MTRDKREEEFQAKLESLREKWGDDVFSQVQNCAKFLILKEERRSKPERTKRDIITSARRAGLEALVEAFELEIEEHHINMFS